MLRIGSLFEIPQLACFAAAMLAFMPRFYGHAFINSKDVPFACAMAWSIFCWIRFLESRGDWSRSLLLALAFGAALALRPGAAPLLVALFSLSAAYVATGEGLTRRLLLRGAAAAALAWALMVAFWPWAHLSPIANPLRAMAAALAFPTVYGVLFDGVVSASDSLPRSYFAHFLLVTTPPFVLLLGMGGIVLCVRDALRQRGASRSSAAGLAALLLPLWLLLPLVSAAVLRPNVYDGIRHILFVLPALALLAGRGAAEILTRLEGSTARRLVFALLVAATLWPTLSLVRLHPYQMTYFNVFAGGLGGAEGRYETDYWVTSYREAAEWLNARAGERQRPLRVIAAVDDHSRACIADYLLDSVELVDVSAAPSTAALPQGFDYYVATTRHALDQRYPESPIAHEIGRDGAVFSVIRERSPAPPRSAPRAGRAPGAR